MGCYDEQNVVPYVKTTVPQEVPKELQVGFTSTAGSGNLVQWLVNGMPMNIDLDQPTLMSIANGDTSFQQGRHVFNVGKQHQVR